MTNLFQVLAFYKNLGIKVRATEYSTEGEALEYISGLRACETPYLMHKDGAILEMEPYGMTRVAMANLIEGYL